MGRRTFLWSILRLFDTPVWPLDCLILVTTFTLKENTVQFSLQHLRNKNVCHYLAQVSDIPFNSFPNAANDSPWMNKVQNKNTYKLMLYCISPKLWGIWGLDTRRPPHPADHPPSADRPSTWRKCLFPLNPRGMSQIWPIPRWPLRPERSPEVTERK